MSTGKLNHGDDSMRDPDKPKCDAKSSKGHPCPMPLVTGSKLCRTHGGASSKGMASSQYKHGRYTDAVPSSLGADQDRAVSDADAPN